MTAVVRLLCVCVLILTGCAAPRQLESSDAIAAQKQQAIADRTKRRESEAEALRSAIREVYVRDHPALVADIRRAILKERLKVGMSMWDVFAAYSLWGYANTNDPRVAEYRDSGVVSLWILVKREIRSAPAQQEEWVLQRQKDVQHLYFEKGKLTGWKG